MAKYNTHLKSVPVLAIKSTKRLKSVISANLIPPALVYQEESIG